MPSCSSTRGKRENSLRPSAGLAVLSQEIGLRVCGMAFREVVECAFQEAWTRDPFDRLIVANAKARNATLITWDEHRHQYRSLKALAPDRQTAC